MSNFNPYRRAARAKRRARRGYSRRNDGSPKQTEPFFSVARKRERLRRREADARVKAVEQAGG